jgi:predicted transcriptional regulator YdeE
MEVKTIATFECEVIKKEYRLVGQSVTVNFPKAFPDAAMKVQMDFEKRRDEVRSCKNKHVLISPYMCNDIVATYFACVEVEALSEIPEGMIGFNIPMTSYAKISCSNKTIDEGYSKLFAWMNENGYKQKWYDKTFPIETFYLEENVEEEVVELLIPIH